MIPIFWPNILYLYQSFKNLSKFIHSLITEVNLVEKHLTQIGVLSSDDYFHYDDFYELIDHVEKELEKSA